MTPAKQPQCLCEQCKMTVLQCKDRSAANNNVLDELEKYIDGMYPVPPKEGDYLYPSRKGRREVYDQIRGVIKELRTKER